MSSDDTSPETPEAKRLSLPAIDIDPEEPAEVTLRKLANALLTIAENLQYLRLAAERDERQESANKADIALLKERMTRAEQRIAIIERGEST